MLPYWEAVEMMEDAKCVLSTSDDGSEALRAAAVPQNDCTLVMRLPSPMGENKKVTNMLETVLTVWG